MVGVVERDVAGVHDNDDDIHIYGFILFLCLLNPLQTLKKILLLFVLGYIN